LGAVGDHARRKARGSPMALPLLTNRPFTCIIMTAGQQVTAGRRATCPKRRNSY